MKILERTEIRKITTIRLLRIVNWINSDYSGFRCANLFLMRSGLVVEVSLKAQFELVLLKILHFFKFLLKGFSVHHCPNNIDL